VRVRFAEGFIDRPVENVFVGDLWVLAGQSNMEGVANLVDVTPPHPRVMVQASQVPVGLVACAHGGTSMAQWDPAKKGDGGKSLYGSMLRQIKLAGGQVKGVLWYQGESDANPPAAEVFPKVFSDFIAAVRADTDQLELPF